MSTPQSNFTLECEQALNECKTLAELYSIKKGNNWRIAASLRLEAIYTAKVDELKAQKPDLSIKQPVLDSTPKGRADLSIDGEAGYLYSMTERAF